MTNLLTPGNNTVAVQVSGAALSSTSGRSGVVQLGLGTDQAFYDFGAYSVPQDCINFASLAPSVLQPYICGNFSTEVRGMWLVVAAAGTATTANLLAMLPEANTLAVSMMGRGDKLRVAMPGPVSSGDPNFSEHLSPFRTSFLGTTGSTSFRRDGTLAGSTIPSEAFASATWTKSAGSRALTQSSAVHGVSAAHSLVLGSGFFRTAQAVSQNPLSMWVGPEINVPTANDLLASGTYGWSNLSFFLVYRTTVALDVLEAALMISPRWVDAPRLIRPVDASLSTAVGGVRLVANVQPLTVSFQAGSAPVQVTAPSELPLAVTVMNSSLNTNVVNPALDVNLAPTTVLPVCGAPWPHPRVAVTGVRLSGLGVEIDRPLTVTNRPGCEEVILPKPFAVGLDGVAPMVVTSDIPISQSASGTIIGDSIARPVRISGDGAGPVVIKPSDDSVIKVTQAIGSMFDIRAGTDQLQPLWISDTDPDG